MPTTYQPRALTTTTSQPRGVVSTTVQPRAGVVSDLGAGLDTDLALMTDEDGNIILFHTGDFYPQETLYQPRPLI